MFWMSGVQILSFQPGAAAENAEKLKLTKYEEISKNHYILQGRLLGHGVQRVPLLLNPKPKKFKI